MRVKLSGAIESNLKPSTSKILWMRTLMYLQTGYLLHLMGLLGILLFFYFGNLALRALHNDLWGWFVWYAYLSLYGFTLPIFSQFDAFSRYQNYKVVKDKIFEYGFDERLLRPFVYSRCQRDAIKVATRCFHLQKQYKAFERRQGFAWYHILPHLVVRRPAILFTRAYWQSTLFVPRYHSKYFLW